MPAVISGNFTGVLGGSASMLGAIVLGAPVPQSSGPSSAPLSTIFLTGNIGIPVLANISHFVGDDKTFQIQVFAADGVTPIDITTMAFSFTMHAYGSPSVIFYQKTTAAGTILLFDPTQGIMQVICNAADTIGLLPNEYGYFLERTDIGNDNVPTFGLYTLKSR